MCFFAVVDAAENGITEIDADLEFSSELQAFRVFLSKETYADLRLHI